MSSRGFVDDYAALPDTYYLWKNRVPKKKTPPRLDQAFRAEINAQEKEIADFPLSNLRGSEYRLCSYCGTPIAHDRHKRGHPIVVCEKCKKRGSWLKRFRERRRLYMQNYREKLKEFAHVYGWNGPETSVQSIDERIRVERKELDEQKEKLDRLIIALAENEKKYGELWDKFVKCHHQWEYELNFRICTKCHKVENVIRLTFRTVPEEENYSRRFPRSSLPGKPFISE